MEWSEWSLVDEAPGGWSHHGLALLGDGTLVGFHPGEGRLLFFDPQGELLRTAACAAVEAHDIAVDRDGLWLADCGHKLARGEDGQFGPKPSMDQAVGQVLLVDLDGHTRQAITSIDHPTYAAGGPFLPTGVAVDDRGLWIADGYGSNLVHLVDRDGAVLLTLDGFDCPHGVAIDRRRPEPLLYVAERGRNRLCVYDLDGTLLRHAGEGDLLYPCAMATVGDRLAVAELIGRLTFLDLDDQLLEHVGGDRQTTNRPGWPNALDPTGDTVAPVPTAGTFNSPHGVTTDGSGTVYVTEWVLGGRRIRLR